MPGATCSPSYSGGRDQEDHGSRPIQANSPWDPISKIPNTERTGGGASPEFKPQYHTHTKKNHPWWMLLANYGGEVIAST
jgi:hypothetical protein